MLKINQYKYGDYDVIEVVKNGTYCTIVMEQTEDDFDVVVSYEGEYDEQVITELLSK